MLLEKQRAEREFTGEVRGTERSLAAADRRNAEWTLLALASALALAIWMNRSIGRPIERLRAAAVRLGQGQLDTRTGIRREDELGTLALTFDHMAADLAATTVSKAYLDSILGSMSEMVFVLDHKWRIQRVNPAVLAHLGFAEPQLLGKSLAELLDELRDESQNGSAAGTRARSLLGQRTATLQSAWGDSVPVLLTTAVLRDAANSATGFVASAVNITERQRAEARLQASLEEKEVLLREVHHRVKNNLQIISSLLSLQAQDADDAGTLQMFAESQSRIRSMALIHEQLYRSNQFASVEFGAYARQLCENLERASGPDKHISVSVSSDAPPLPLDQAVPCGMVLNELVSNALKHAFVGEALGEVRIEFNAVRGGLRRLVVADNGVGIDRQQAIDHSSLGLTVVDALVRQLKGHWSVENTGGARFEVVFPAAEAIGDDGAAQSLERPGSVNGDVPTALASAP